MNRLQLIERVRSLTRDLSNAIFREVDIVNYLNEGIERFQQSVPEFASLNHLNVSTDAPTLIPRQYHHLLALYSASRCFGQDERHYQASNFMNEFETKLDELKSAIESGEIAITDPDTGGVVLRVNPTGYVVDSYFNTRRRDIDFDNGAEGVE